MKNINNFGLLAVIFLHSTIVLAINVEVVGVGSGGSATGPVGDYRWTLEEDVNTVVVPGVQVGTNTLSVNFHKSHMPLVASGDSSDISRLDTLLLSGKRYFLSILPNSGFSNGGAPIASGLSSVTIKVNENPIEAAQITVFVFEDSSPINNAVDATEQALSGFTVNVVDAAGRYGAPGGHTTMDVFGNPIGSTYLPNGDLDVPGQGHVITDADGFARIKNLAPGKYGITVIPPAGQAWQQTTTIEGTLTNDVWVAANEPELWSEFAKVSPHMSIGFLKPKSLPAGGAFSIVGTVKNIHLSAPPKIQLFNSSEFGHIRCWIALNEVVSERGVYAQPCPSMGSGDFTIPSVPPGTYQLVIFDSFLDLIIDFSNVSVNANTCSGNICDIGDKGVNNWFARLENYVFYDQDQDGFRDLGEVGIPEQNVNVRFRDGTVYQSFPTDVFGTIPFDTLFPFFSWLVAEVDYARHKATGVTVWVDAGGAIPEESQDPFLIKTFGDRMNPKFQDDGGFLGGGVGGYFRTDKSDYDQAPVGSIALLQGFQAMAGQTNVLEWGKVPYDIGENGGISGVVFYATTRAENDPRFAAAEEWEPGIPRVRVNLWDKTYTTLLNTTTTDSWDDSLPTNCVGTELFPPYLLDPTKCFDGLRNWNQVRPAVFDGGYGFTHYYPSGLEVENPTAPQQRLPRLDGSVPYPLATELPARLLAGEYIIEVITPAGYEILKEEDKNVDFGDTFSPTPQLLPAECAGEPHTVPSQLTLFPGVDVSPTLANKDRPLCDRKKVVLRDQQNAAADFFLFTKAPIAAHAFGQTLDDLAIEGDPNSPLFGEKYAPPFIPIAFFDFRGNELNRTYADEFGHFNALLPSTYTANILQPSGMSPAMITSCMNARKNPDGTTDPFFNPRYGTACYTLQYMPGTTTYLDTPVLPISAFAGSRDFPLDCELPSETPRIKSVTSALGGPVILSTGTDRALTIKSVGRLQVSNPKFSLAGTEPATIPRDYGFGLSGTVTVGGVALSDVTWSDAEITGNIPASLPPGDYQLLVTRGSNFIASTGVTIHIVNNEARIKKVGTGGFPTIQAAIDDASTVAGDIILVGPNRGDVGVYEEMVILYKAVKLQGLGEGSITIDGIDFPVQKLFDWRKKVSDLITAGNIPLLAGQINPANQGLATEEGAAVFVAGNFGTAAPQVDGFTITGALSGGGVVVNGLVNNVEISNNRVGGNAGFAGGGIRLGHPALLTATGYTSAQIQGAKIHHNQVSMNGGIEGAAGGIGVNNGSLNTQVTDNFVCGNLNQSHGGGIGVLGNVDGALIQRNLVAFNESYNPQGFSTGGGIALVGQAPIDDTRVTAGTGDITVEGNYIIGNYAASGDGGGVSLFRTNGIDVQGNNPRPGLANGWHYIRIFDNIVVNNVTAAAGAGISLQDAVVVDIVHNTIANNDSVAALGALFNTETNQSAPQIAGIVSHNHSADLQRRFNNSCFLRNFSNPEVFDNIIWHNRSSYLDGTSGSLEVVSGAVEFRDLGVLERTDADLAAEYSVLSNAAGFVNSTGCFDSTQNTFRNNRCSGPTPVQIRNCHNIGGNDPAFVAPYFNAQRSAGLVGDAGGIGAVAAVDEAGNFIKLSFGPLSLEGPLVATSNVAGNYHIGTGSSAADVGKLLSGVSPLLHFDVDNQARPCKVDIGADERDPDASPCTASTAGTVTPVIPPSTPPVVGQGPLGVSAGGCQQGVGHVPNSDFALFLIVLGSFLGLALRHRNKKGQGGNWKITTLLLLLVAGGSGSGYAAINGVTGPTFNFKVSEGHISTADGGSIYFWGYGNDNGPAQYVGPTLILNQGEAVTINLLNALPSALGTKVSLEIPGIVVASPSCVNAGDLTCEAVAGGPAVTYTFTPSQPGTYLYHSGTQMDLQVEMGLIGAIIVRPTGFSNRAYSHIDTTFDNEFLFLLSEMDPRIHQKIELEGASGIFALQESDAPYSADDATPIRSLLNDYEPSLWFINGRSAPDTMADAGAPWLPAQPYNCMPSMYVGDKILLRMLSGGRESHPFHTHGNHMRVIAQDARVLSSTPDAVEPAPDLGQEFFTHSAAPGQTADAIFEWTGAKLGWDIYGGAAHAAEKCDSLADSRGNTTGTGVKEFDSDTLEYCPDHGKAIPVVLPGLQEITIGGFWSGSPYLGVAGDLPPGEGGNNPSSGFMHMWHSHNEKEITNDDIFPGGMLTMLLVDARPLGTPPPASTPPGTSNPGTPSVPVGTTPTSPNANGGLGNILGGGGCSQSPNASVWSSLMALCALLALGFGVRTIRKCAPKEGAVMSGPRGHRIKAGLFAIAVGFSFVPDIVHAKVFVQCPCDSNGDAIPDMLNGSPLRTDRFPGCLPQALQGKGLSLQDIQCKHLGAGDGFVQMADGYPQYIFGFTNITGQPSRLINGEVNPAIIPDNMLGVKSPAPLINIEEGKPFFLSLTNLGMGIRADLFDPHSVHFHGFPQASAIFDGMPEGSLSIGMGSSVTYYYAPEDPGTYMYHCHVEATEHMQMGMLGNLYVSPKQNRTKDKTALGSGFIHQTGFKYVYNDDDGSTWYDVEYPIQLGSFDSAFHDASYTVQPLDFRFMRDNYPFLNGRGYPDSIARGALPAPEESQGVPLNNGEPSLPESSLITATVGQKVLLRLSNLNVTNHYTLATTGIPMRVVGRDAKILRSSTGENLSYLTNSITLGGGESTDVILDTAGVPTGRYLLYTTNLNYLSNNMDDYGGMMTEIRLCTNITDPLCSN